MVREVIGEIKEPYQMHIMPGWTTSTTVHDKIDLSSELVPGVITSYPFIAAAMTSVVDERFTEECAKNGIIATVPSQFPIERARRIVQNTKDKEVRKGDLEFVGKPEFINIDSKLKDAVGRYHKAGHSVIPICDEYRNLRASFIFHEGIPTDFMELDLAEAIKNAKRKKRGWTNIIKPFNIENSKHGVDYVSDKSKPRTIQNCMKKARKRYMPVVDKNGSMKGLAFIYKHNGYAVGGAIHTYKWEKRAEALLGAGADVIVIDASDGASDYQLRTLRKFKKMFPDSYICAGNVVKSTALKKSRSGKIIEVPVYDKLVEAGADIIKIGMGSGRICLTTDNRGVGRLLMRALYDFQEARERCGEYRPLIADGGIGTFDPDFNKRAHVRNNLRQDTRSITSTLTIADYDMMGTYFNMCEEAAGKVHEIDGKLYKENWGEGSYKARSFARYDVVEGVKRADIEEGGFYKIPMVGRLKPLMERTALGLTMTMANVGAKNLQEYRMMSILESV